MMTRVRSVASAASALSTTGPATVEAARTASIEREPATAAAPSGYPRPGFGDWLLLAGSVMFVAGGLFIIRSDPNTGIVTIAVFGLAAAVHAVNLVRKWRFYRMRRPLQVHVVGGVPIRPLRGNLVIAGAGIAALGVVIVVFGRHYGLVMWSIGWLLAATGIVLLLALAGRLLPVGYLRFDAPGITIAGRDWAYMIPWDNISQMATGEYNRNPVLLIRLHHEDAIEVRPPERKGKVLKRLAWSTALFGAPVMLMPSQYGLDLPLLVQALERYITIAPARAELSRHLVE
jgi:hypothetical protein